MLRFIRKARKYLPYVLVAAVTAVIMSAVTASVGKAAVTQPVYVCQDFTTCANGQFLEVFDHLGNPIFSVGQTGGPKTFGDSTSVYPPSSIYNPAVTTSYQAPTGTTCVAPALWISPQGFYTCSALGAWVWHAI